MDKEESLEVLEKEFKKYVKEIEYEKLKNNISKIVNKTIISKGFLYNIIDYENEIAGYKKGKILKKLPENTKDVKIYHFNENNQIVLIEKYGRNVNIVDREYCFYERNSIKTIYYNSPKSLRNVKLSFNNKNNRTETVCNYGKYGVTIQKYIYYDDVLKKILIDTKEHEDEEYENQELMFEFKENILVKITQLFSNGYTKIIYE